MLARVEKHGEDEQADGQQNYSDRTRPHQSEFTPGLTTGESDDVIDGLPGEKKKQLCALFPRGELQIFLNSEPALGTRSMIRWQLAGHFDVVCQRGLASVSWVS
jgi:hypothetical protein